MPALLAALLLAASCAYRPEQHAGRGVVRELRDGGKVLVIEHEEIPGFMAPMTMPFDVADPRLSEGLAPGTTVRFTVSKLGGRWPITSLQRAE